MPRQTFGEYVFDVLCGREEGMRKFSVRIELNFYAQFVSGFFPFELSSIRWNPSVYVGIFIRSKKEKIRRLGGISLKKKLGFFFSFIYNKMGKKLKCGIKRGEAFLYYESEHVTRKKA